MIFIFIGLIIFSTITFYVGYNGWIWLKETFGFKYKKGYFLFVMLSSGSFIINELMPNIILMWSSYFWLIVLAFGVLIIPIMNLVYFLTKKKGIKIMGFVLIGIYVFIVSFGSYNAWNTVVRTYDVKIEKSSSIENLKILLISDIHISNMIGEKQLRKLVKLSEELKPDIIFLAGDTIEGSMKPYLKNNLSKEMSQLNAPLGTYVVLGNHEYYGKEISSFISEMYKSDIKVLLDEVKEINEAFYLIGRNDYHDKTRLKINELIRGIDKEKPIILIDHQPREYDEISKSGIDLMVSGHTHRGQLFPANLITNAMYENDWGYLKKGNLHTVVSSGFGLWGPPFRIGSRSEVVIINVTFSKD